MASSATRAALRHLHLHQQLRPQLAPVRRAFATSATLSTQKTPVTHKTPASDSDAASGGADAGDAVESVQCNLLDRVSTGTDQGHRAVGRHRPKSVAPLDRRRVSKAQWKKMDRPKFRMLLKECMASGVVGAMLRRYLAEFPIMGEDWNNEELMLIVSALLKSNRSSVAMDLLHNQLSEGDKINRLNAVIAECARLGNAPMALQVLVLATQLSLQPDVVTYTSAIHACARGVRDNVLQAFEILDEMTRAGVEPNRRTYGAIVLAYARLNRWDDIEELMESIPFNAQLIKSEVFQSAIVMCARNHQYVFATRLYAMLMRDGIYPGENASTTALSACARTGDLKTMHEIIEFIDKHQAPTIFTYNAMISAFGNARCADDALAVFERMQQAAPSIQPDLVTYNALLMAARRSRRPDVVPGILKRMAQHDIPWDVYTLDNLLELCMLTGEVERAEQYCEQFKAQQSVHGPRSRLGIDRANYETLLGVYFEAGRYEKVLDVWRNDVTCRRRAKTSKTLNYLLRACAHLSQVSTAKELIAEFEARGQKISSLTHNHLLSAYLMADDDIEAQNLLREMTSSPKSSTVLAFTAVMKHAWKKEQYADVLDVFDWYQDTRRQYQYAYSPQLHLTADAIYILAARAAARLGDHERLVSIYSALQTVKNDVDEDNEQRSRDDEEDYATSATAEANRATTSSFSPADATLPMVTSLTVRVEIARLLLASCDKQLDWRCAVSMYDELSKLVDEDTNLALYEMVVKTVGRAGEFESALDVNGGEWYRKNRPDQGWF